MIRRNWSLDAVKIASPCRASWDEMTGTERVRFCEDCGLHVYNLSGMTPPEAETLLRQSEGRTCLRFHRRKDGTILTRNCPVGVQAFRRKVAILVGLAAATMLYIFSHILLPHLNTRDADREQWHRSRSRTFASVLDWLDPVPKWEPTPAPHSMGW